MTGRGKKRISLFLCLVMLCSLLPAPASAEQQIVVGNALIEEDGPVTEADPAAGQEEADEPGKDTPNDTDVTPEAEGTAEPETASAEPAETEQPEAGEEADETVLPEDGNAEPEEEEGPRQYFPEESWSDAAPEDPANLLDAYAEQVLERALPGHQALRAQGYSIEGRDFSAAESYAFYTLKSCVTETAAGNISATIYTVDFSQLPETDHVWTAEALGYTEITDENVADAYKKVAPSLTKILRALLSACPYELYWFDKTVGIRCLTGDILVTYTNSALTLDSITYRFVVAQEFAAGEYAVNTRFAGSIQTAVTTAEQIAGSVAGLSDYEKLKVFKNRICELTSYNSSAGSSSTTTPFGNPWQLIWVFDGDSSTKVVCEGYSKAFQYLCDLCSFTSGEINCYTATGTANSGRHMWNIVHMDDGHNYLVDVTNCDSGKVGHPDLLFLKGWKSGSPSSGYKYRGESSVGAGYFLTYVYDSNTRLVYTEEELTLSGVDYHVHEALAPVTENRIEPSYEHEGSYEEVVYCKKCGEEISRTLIPIARLTPLGTPVLTRVANRGAVVELEWAAVEGAKQYRVLRRTEGESWGSALTIGETAQTSLSDGTATHGTAYDYTVQCYDPDLQEAAGAFDETGLRIVRHIMQENAQNARPATCTEEGYSGDCVCSECGETVFGHVIEALGHAEELRNHRDASFTEEGYSGDVYCSRCGELLQEGTVLPKLEAVMYGDLSLTAGTSLSLTAQELSGKTVRWSFAGADDAQYASLISTSGKLTAKAVSERHTVVVLACAADDSVKVLFSVEIIPAVSSLLLLDESGEEVTGQTVVFDMNNTETGELRFSAVVQPEGASHSVNWKVSDGKGAYASYAAAGEILTVSGFRATGTVALTAEADDGSDKTAKVSLKIVRYPASVQIEPPDLPVSESEYVLRGGKSLSLKTNVVSEPGLTDRTVFWSLSDDSLPYAGISSSGRLSTKTVYEPVSIRVRAETKSGMEDELTIRLFPSAAAVKIYNNSVQLDKGQTICVPQGDSLCLTGNNLPAEALQGGTWKSSNARVAAVNTDGCITGIAAGTATITYTAADDSGKSTSVKIQVGSRAGLDRLTPDEGSLKSGKTMTLAALNVGGSVIAAKTLKWESSNPAAATVSTAGKVTAKTVSDTETVRIRAYSPYEPEIVKEAVLTVSPAKDSLSLRCEGENLTGKTVLMDAAQPEQVELTANIYRLQSEDMAETAVTWTSNNTKVAAVENGRVCFTGSTGSAAVTAKCGKLSAKVSFKVIRAVTGISITGKNGAEPVLISGKSLQLAASVSPADATTKNLLWSSSDPNVAAVSSSGKVMAKTVYSASTVTITAAAKDGSGAAGDYTLTVYPAASWVRIEQPNDDSAVRVMNGRTVPAVPGEELRLRAALCPAEARQDTGITWSSSNAKLAEVDSNGTVRVKAKGSVKITAKANDGSGKSASFTLKIS